MKKIIISVLLFCSCIAQAKMQSDDSINIYFARHGKTILNTADRVQGWIDSPLTEQGIEVAKYLGAGLKDIPFDGFYTSDAGRQRETMSILLSTIQKNDSPVTEDKRLREVYFGSFEGGFNQEMADASAKKLGLKNANDLMENMKSGTLNTKQVIDSIAQADSTKQAETFEQVELRMQAVLNDIVQNAIKHDQKNILAVSSGTSMQAMIFDLTENQDKNKPLANATIVKIVYKDGKYIVEEIGSKTYIEKGKQIVNSKK